MTHRHLHDHQRADEPAPDKLRQQFGLQRFIRMSLPGFLAVTLLQIFVHSVAPR